MSSDSKRDGCKSASRPDYCISCLCGFLGRVTQYARRDISSTYPSRTSDSSSSGSFGSARKPELLCLASMVLLGTGLIVLMWSSTRRRVKEIEYIDSLEE